MKPTQDLDDTSSEPIAWARNGRLLWREHPGGRVLCLSGWVVATVSEASLLDAVPLVRQDEVQAVAEWLIAEAAWKSATPGGRYWIGILERRLDQNRDIAEWLVAEARWERDVARFKKPRKEDGFGTAAFMESLRETNPYRTSHVTDSPAQLRLIAEWLVAEARWGRLDGQNWRNAVSAALGVKPGEFNLSLDEAVTSIRETRHQSDVLYKEVLSKSDALDEVREVAKWLIAEARWDRDHHKFMRGQFKAAAEVAEFERDNPLYVKPFDGLTPEALRSAADVVQLCWIKMFGSSDRVPTILRAEADRMEKAHAEAEAAARRRTARAVKAYDVWKVPMSLPWDDLTQDRKEVWLAVVDALEDGAA